MSKQAKDTPTLRIYDIFILLLTILSLIVIVFLILPMDDQVTQILLIYDTVISFVFLGDFVYNLIKAPSKSKYFFSNGWLDLLGSIPAIPIFRFARIARFARILRVLRTVRSNNLRNELWQQRAQASILFAIFLTLTVILLASISILPAERINGDANISNAQDALWWAFVTITTVGYGDFYPVTGPGRLIAVALMTLGVGLFGVLSSFMASIFIKEPPKQEGPTKDDFNQLKKEIQNLKKIVQENKKTGK